MDYRSTGRWGGPLPVRSAHRCVPRVAAALVAVALAATACSSGTGAKKAGLPAASASTAAPTTPTVAVRGGAKVSYKGPVTVTVTDGTLESVQVTTAKGGQQLEGEVAPDKRSWVSEAAPKPGTSYQVEARVTDAAGTTAGSSLTFAVAKVPADSKLAFTVTPDDGTTVGIGQPIVVRFLSPVTRRAAIEKVMTVDATTPAGAAVAGSWHWLNGQQVHWRPKKFWKPGTKVHLAMEIAGVKASSSRYGRKDYTQTFTIGASHVTKVDAVSKRLKVYRDGKLVSTWLTGMGKKGLETYSGTYVVLGKSQVVQMDSCSARITCDKKDPDFYDEKEYWATRLTASGTFIHAAGWDPLIGRANVSHGCIHLSDANAKTFFQRAVPGDVVIVSRTGRGPQQRITTQDPGLYDWNLSWSQWVKGSALS